MELSTRLGLPTRLELKAKYLAVITEVGKGMRGQKDYNPDAYAEAMVPAVNAQRILRGLDTVNLETVMRIETLALGHSDYSEKFALYCAELAMGESNIIA